MNCPEPTRGTSTKAMAGLLRTLIVDDEPVARRILREELETFEDVQVVGEAENGAAALERIAERHPDLVLLDLRMPVMGGLDVVRSLEGGISFAGYCYRHGVGSVCDSGVRGRSHRLLAEARVERAASRSG